MAAEDALVETALTRRQEDVLDAALALLVEGGDAITMTAVARRASCSKETLYKWFGGRDGLLTATVQWQASKVRAAPLPAEGLDRAALSRSLEGFARDWLTVLSGETSVALNRLAVGQAGSQGDVRGGDKPGRSDAGRNNLGAIVLENGPFAMRKRLGAVLDAGRAARLIAFEDADDAFSTFFGLVVRDVQIRLLLGDRLAPTKADIARNAKRATEQFLLLHEIQAAARKGAVD